VVNPQDLLIYRKSLDALGSRQCQRLADHFAEARRYGIAFALKK
jgi:hypothetical protein